MKKILIIDNKLHEWADVTKSPLLEYSSTPKGYFKWDDAGNHCDALFEVDQFAYVFIHHSQKGDSLLPSTIIDLIKPKLQEKLILFSGSMDTHLLNTENPRYRYRTIRRDILIPKFDAFVNKSGILGGWTIEMLFLNYEQKLVNTIRVMPDAGIDKVGIKKSKELKELLLLKHIKEGSDKYNDLMSFEGDAFFEKLIKL